MDNAQIMQKIYVIRGREVMMDYDLAQIYGYETKVLNRQVKNNAAKFEGEDSMFQLTKEEYDAVRDTLRCKNCTSKIKDSMHVDGRGGARYLPHAFTEQGVYMLMTVLRGELATRQSRALVMAFKAIKDYVVDSGIARTMRGELNMAMGIVKNTQDVLSIKREIETIERSVTALSEKIENAVMKSDLSDIVENFSEVRIIDKETKDELRGIVGKMFQNKSLSFAP